MDTFGKINKMDKKTSFNDSTYSLMKGLHHVNIAKQFMEDVRFNTAGELKMIFNQYIQKCEWIINNVKHRLTPLQIQEIEKELSDSIFFDAINDKLLILSNEQRNIIESTIDAMISGNEVKIIEQDDESTKTS